MILKQRHLTLIALLVIVTLSISGCNTNKSDEFTPVEASYTLSPQSGETTTIFKFDASKSLSIATKQVPVFVRWDWENDGIWDSQYSTQSNFSHRYLIPGEHTAMMEVSNIFGLRDSISLTINVAQGYSPPHSHFIIYPDSANILTQFEFDASLTKDDEDSLSTLQFRWDFNGDSIWDSEFSSDPTASFLYNMPALYGVKLEAKDPSGLFADTTIHVLVNLLDDRLHPSFVFDCGHCTTEDTIVFDARLSFHEDPTIEYNFSWDFGDDGIWEYQNTKFASISSVIESEGANPVRLRMTDEQGLTMDIVDTVHLFGPNSEPIARVFTSSHVGNSQSEFYLHAKASYDRDESILDLRYRWDINGDGVWDSEYNDLMEIFISFTESGKHGINLGVFDSGDKYSIVSDTIEIFEGKNETGYIIDKRGSFGGDLYGTVKIGNQWWMQENLRYSNEYMNPPILLTIYENDPKFFEEYGALYFPQDLYHSRGLCPKGWRVPGVEDFETLFSYLEEDITSKIIYGGKSEFHLKMGGWKEVDVLSRGYPFMTHLWTADRNIQGQLPIGVFINTKPKDTRFVFVNDRSAYYVRCIKE